MNSFDQSIMDFFNRFAHKSVSFDSLVAFIAYLNLIKGCIIISILWFFWFHKSEKIDYNRERIVIALFSGVVAIFVARGLADFLPYRERPLFNTGIHFLSPYNNNQEGLHTWSSFPSDHAVLFFALATGIYLISKKIGILSYLYVLIFICLPRVYLGIHYPTDILGGAVLGILITLLLSINRISQPVIKKVFQFSSKFPGIFYSLFFLLSFEIASMFQASQKILGFIKSWIHFL